MALHTYANEEERQMKNLESWSRSRRHNEIENKVESERQRRRDRESSVVLDGVYDIDCLLSRSILISDLDTCEQCDCSENI